MRLLTAVLGAVLLVSAPLSEPRAESAAEATEADADIVVGRAQVLAPDVIAIDQRLIQLFGVDAPEERQPCFSATGRRWNCAVAAAKTLLDLVGDFEVTCERRAPDRYRRMYAVCTVNGRDINAALVRAGMAMAVREETLDYVSDEEAARAQKLGIWQGDFMPPWEFRRTQAGQRQPRR